MYNNKFRIVDIHTYDSYHDIEEHLIGKTGSFLYTNMHFDKNLGTYSGTFYLDMPISVKFVGESDYTTINSCFFQAVFLEQVNTIPDNLFTLGD